VHYLTMPFICQYLIKRTGSSLTEIKNLPKIILYFETIAYAAGTVLLNNLTDGNFKPTQFSPESVIGVKEAEQVLKLAKDLKHCHEVFKEEYLEKGF